MKPLISVIIPVYNVENYLDRCVESVVNQTYENLEIILVDDGSPDNCPQMCDAWAKKDCRIKVVHKKNGGVSSARNEGIKISGGDFVHFVDPDDWLDVDAYNSIKNFFDEKSLTVFNSYIVNKSETVIGFSFNKKIISENEEIRKELIKGNLAWTNCWTKIFSLNTIKKNNLYFKEDYCVGEDFYFLYQYSKFVNKVEFVDAPVYYHYFSRADSAMNKKMIIITDAGG